MAETETFAWTVASSNCSWDHLGGGCGTWLPSSSGSGSKRQLDSQLSWFKMYFNITSWHSVILFILNHCTPLAVNSHWSGCNIPDVVIHPLTSVPSNKVRPQRSCCFLAPHWPVSRAEAGKAGHGQRCQAISSQIWLVQSLGFTLPPQSHRLIGPIVQ